MAILKESVLLYDKPVDAPMCQGFLKSGDISNCKFK